MDRFAMDPAGASVWLLLLVGIVVYLGVLTVWAHVSGARRFGRGTKRADTEYRSSLRPWMRRVTLMYAAGWAVFAWGTLAIGVVEGGGEFVSERIALFVVWVLSPGGVAALAHAYWTLWAKLGIPYEPER